ncbi:MAG: hypothetical protein BAJATHORv1_20169 [Candidatus Thorarchaeota archaeon]|nr:MAG: hypothetical protein BAJATHORv1_20169 [Candidatus Thorarchaeota archaeon]
MGVGYQVKGNRRFSERCGSMGGPEKLCPFHNVFNYEYR